MSNQLAKKFPCPLTLVKLKRKCDQLHASFSASKKPNFRRRGKSQAKVRSRLNRTAIVQQNDGIQEIGRAVGEAKHGMYRFSHGDTNPDDCLAATDTAGK